MTVSWKKDRKRWIYDFELNKERPYGYCVHPETGKDARNKTEAKAIEALIKARMRTEGARPAAPNTFTLGEAFAGYASRAKHRRNWLNIRDYIIELNAFFEAATPADSITEARCWEYVEWAKTRVVRVWIGGPDRKRAEGKTVCWKDGTRLRSHATINRYLSALRAALRLAHTTRDPGDPTRVLLSVPPLVPKLKVPRRLPRPPSPTELMNVMSSAPQHTMEAVQASALTGMRKATVVKLEVDQIDDENGLLYLDGANTKGQRDEAIPLVGDTLAFFRNLKKQAKDRGVKWLIAWQPREGGPWKPVKDFRRSWNTAQDRSGNERRFRFHDVKAHFVTTMIEHTDAHTAQELAHHKSFETTRSYLAVVNSRKRAALTSANETLGKLARVKSPGRKPRTKKATLQERSRNP